MMFEMTKDDYLLDCVEQRRLFPVTGSLQYKEKAEKK